MPPADRSLPRPTHPEGDVHHVCAWLVRALFNISEYHERADIADIPPHRWSSDKPYTVLSVSGFARRSGPVPPGQSAHAPGAQSRIFIYRDKATDRVIAVAHRRPVVTGKPQPQRDPVWLFAGIVEPGDPPANLRRWHDDNYSCGPVCQAWKQIAQKSYRRDAT